MHRFYVTPDVLRANSPVVQGEELHHLSRVLRLKAGQRVTLFDGEGNEATAILQSVESKEAVCSILNRSTSTPLPCAITLGQAVPKGKNMDFIIQKSVELGAARIIPLLSERTVVELGRKDVEKKADKWRDVIVEAAKQCGQNWLPKIDEPLAMKQFLAAPHREELLLVASLQPGARPLKHVVGEVLKRSRPKSVCILVGPEGDFTPSELASAHTAGFLPVSLGPIILRVETAALYCLSVLASELFS